MKRGKLSDLTTEQLVQQFAELAVEQDMALLSLMQTKVNKLFLKLEAIKAELRVRAETAHEWRAMRLTRIMTAAA